MQNAPRNKYNEITEQCKQAETIILLNADLLLTHETLTQEGKELLDTIKKQTWRINKLLKKIDKGSKKKWKERDKK